MSLGSGSPYPSFMSIPLKSQLAFVMSAAAAVSPGAPWTTTEAEVEILANLDRDPTLVYGLPVADPHVPGRLWLNSGTPTVSQS